MNRLARLAIVITILAAAPGWAELSGTAGIRGEARFPLAGEPVVPGRTAVFGSFGAYSFPSDLLSFFLDGDGETGLLFSIGGIDRWFAESSLRADASLRSGGLLFLAGLSLHAYTEFDPDDTADYAVLLEAAPTASLSGGGPALSWKTDATLTWTGGDRSGLSVLTSAALSFVAAPSVIVDPGLLLFIDLSGERAPSPGATARVSWYPGAPVTADLSARYRYAADDPSPHSADWTADLSLLTRKAALTLSIPGSVESGALAIDPELKAGFPAGGKTTVTVIGGAHLPLSGTDPSDISYGYVSVQAALGF